MQALQTLKEKVKAIYEHDQTVAVNNERLVRSFWHYYNNTRTHGQKFTSPESITRTMRELIRKGSICLTPEQRQKRKENGRAWSRTVRKLSY